MYQKTNREKRMTPKRTKFWCGRCDAAIVGLRGKCKNCGFKHGKKRLKKEDYE
jgi:hypothetical protein